MQSNIFLSNKRPDWKLNYKDVTFEKRCQKIVGDHKKKNKLCFPNAKRACLKRPLWFAARSLVVYFHLGATGHPAMGLDRKYKLGIERPQIANQTPVKQGCISVHRKLYFTLVSPNWVWSPSVLSTEYCPRGKRSTLPEIPETGLCRWNLSAPPERCLRHCLFSL